MAEIGVRIVAGGGTGPSSTVMPMSSYYIEIEERQLADGRCIYGVTVGQEMRKSSVDPGDGLGSAYTPAQTHEEAVQNARRTLSQYRDADNRMDGRPAPTASNTALRDDTDEFTMDEFFVSGTLAAFMQKA